jgi:hypothetical protein
MENVAGIVERFGNYVLGEDGWRAEWVVIKAFVCEERYAPSLRSKFPEVEVNTIPNVENPFIRNDLDMDFQRRSRLHAQANASLANAFAIQMNQPKPAVHLVMTKGFWARWVYDSKQFIVDTWKDGWVARSLMFLCALQLIICTVNIFVQLARLK